LVKRGEQHEPQTLTFRFRCPDAAKAAALRSFVQARRGSDSTVTDVTRPDDLRERWEVTGHVGPAILSQQQLEDLFDFLETAAVLHDAEVGSVGMG
jgi:hypothetical protein